MFPANHIESESTRNRRQPPSGRPKRCKYVRHEQQAEIRLYQLDAAMSNTSISLSSWNSFALPPARPSNMPSFPKPGMYNSKPSARSGKAACSVRAPSVMFRQTPSDPAVPPLERLETSVLGYLGKVSSIMDVKYSRGTSQPGLVYTEAKLATNRAYSRTPTVKMSTEIPPSSKRRYRATRAFSSVLYRCIIIWCIDSR